MISARSVTLRAGTRALLRDVSMDVVGGEVLAVVGPNGAGKSSLLRVLSGELQPSHGVVSLNQRSIATWHARDMAQRRAVVSQAVGLAFPMTARDVVALGRLPWHATPNAARDETATEAALEAVEATSLAGQSYVTLSGGERQRIQIARALAQLDGTPRPAALLLDEPTASLDVRHVGTVLRLLRRLAADGLAVMVVLHDFHQAAFVADRIAVLAAGWQTACGPATDILRASLLETTYGVPFLSQGGVLRPDFSSPASNPAPIA